MRNLSEQRIVADVAEASQHQIGDDLRRGQQVTWPGFGACYLRRCAAGKVEHISASKELTIPARRLATFRAGEMLRRVVAGQRKGNAASACGGQKEAW
jgi:nucleoid DNA-binding protein